MIVRQGYPGPLMPSPFTFAKYGQCGMEVSEIFPHLASTSTSSRSCARCTGSRTTTCRPPTRCRPGRSTGFPSVGSWVTYGLGSETSSLPAFVVIYDARGGPLGGPNDWSAGFMPAAYQGTLFRSTGDPIVDLKPPAGMTAGCSSARGSICWRS